MRIAKYLKKKYHLTEKMKNITTSDIENLPINDRIQLVKDIRGSIAKTPDNLDIPEWHKKELNKRFEDYQ